MIGHTDTVFDDGTVAERPFRVEGERAFGPGTSDMKGGLLAGFFAVEVLQELGVDDFGGITYVCNPDEEIGSPFSGPVIRDLAATADVALVMESARENGDVVSARKGITDLTIELVGRAAHAGVEPEPGRSAIVEAAHKTIELHALNGRWPGVSVNVGVIGGGTRTNVVAERCTLEVDLRAADEASLVAAEEEIRRICTASSVPDVEVTLHEHGWHRPMERTAASERLVELAIATASELGMRVRDASTGGASDANTTSAAGVPTLDGLGPVGGAAHARGEWLDLGGAPEQDRPARRRCWRGSATWRAGREQGTGRPRSAPAHRGRAPFTARPALGRPRGSGGLPSAGRGRAGDPVHRCDRRVQHDPLHEPADRLDPRLPAGGVARPAFDLARAAAPRGSRARARRCTRSPTPGARSSTPSTG